MLPLVKILWAWEREDHFWVAMLPTSFWLSFHLSINSFFSSSCLSSSPFPFIFSLSPSHRHTQLSLSPGVRMRVGRWGDLRALLPLSARCVCLTESVCKKGERERKTAIIHLEEIISHRNQSYCLLKPHTHTFTQSFICPANAKWVYHRARLSFFTAAVFFCSACVITMMYVCRLWVCVCLRWYLQVWVS